MNSIPLTLSLPLTTCYASSFLFRSHPKLKPPHSPFPTLSSTRLPPLRLSTTADDITTSLDQAAPAQTGDITVFLQTSAALFFVYWFANFLVPDLISKYYQFDKLTQDQNPTDEDPLG